MPHTPELTNRILSHFNLPAPTAADMPYLESLINAYTSTVPWGSVCRIAQRTRHPTPIQRARFADNFWLDVLSNRGDGTCFESNYAFFALLQVLGYEGYLTLNNMSETVGCHSAIVVFLDGDKWLVDVGLPLLAPLRLEPRAETRRQQAHHDYVVIGADDGITYEIIRENLPSPYCFHLIDKPIDDVTYRARLVRDHHPDGFFLDKVIMRMVVDGHIWRYNGRENQRVLEEFLPRGDKVTHTIDGDIAEALSAKFGISRDTLEIALANQIEMPTS